jgi:hypothetical protein
MTMKTLEQLAAWVAFSVAIVLVYGVLVMM